MTHETTQKHADDIFHHVSQRIVPKPRLPYVAMYVIRLVETDGICELIRY